MSPTSSRRPEPVTVAETVEVEVEMVDLLAERKRLHELEVEYKASIRELKVELGEKESLLNRTYVDLKANLYKLDQHGRNNG